MCNLLGDLKSACTSIIDSYWDDIWKLIAQEVVCDLLDQSDGCLLTQLVEDRI